MTQTHDPAAGSLLRQEGDPDKALDLLFDALNH